MESRIWRILLVEDDEEDYILTRDLLLDIKSGQFKLDWVSSFEDAIDVFCQQQHDVYLIDYRLGRHDGLELVRQARARGCLSPIILMTGQGSYDVDIEAMRAGANDYLVKSEVTPALLERTIRYAIEKQAAEEALRKAHDELEQRVQERTQELVDANQRLQREISERRQAQEALGQSENRFRKLAESTSTAIFIVQERKIRYANPAARFITGYNPDELVEREFWELAHPNYQKIVKEYGLSNQWIDQLPARYELKMITKNGQERWVDISTGGMEYDGKPALVVTAFDITERDRAERALKKAKDELEARVVERTADLRQANLQLEQLLAQLENERAMLSAIIDHAPEAIVVTDQEARILLTNPAAEAVYNRPVPYRKTYESHASLELYYPDGQPFDPRDMPLTRSALDGETLSNIEMNVIWPNGEVRNLLVSSAPLRDRQGKISGAIGIFQDITQHKQAEEEKRRDSAQIEVQRHLILHREMERMDVARDLHDGPLQELIGLTYSLTEVQQFTKALTPETQQLALIKLNAIQDRLRSQIRELRTFCSDLRPPTLAPFGLEKAIRSHAESFQQRYNHLALHLNLMPDGTRLPEKVRLALFRIYQESLNNVVRHSEADEVQVHFQLEDGHAKLRIQDNGRGFSVPEEWLELARRGHLGLVGAQERASAVGGTLEIESRPGAGTTVQVVVPVNGGGRKSSKSLPKTGQTG